MRIVHLTDHYQPWMGYQESYLPQEQQRLGHDVSVITSNRYAKKAKKLIEGGDPKPGTYLEQGVQVHRLAVWFELPTQAGYLLMRGLRDQLAAIKPDVVHCHNILHITGLLAALYQRELGYALIYDTHMSKLNVFHAWESPVRRQLKAWIYKLEAWLTRPWIPKRANLFVPIGEPECDFIEWVYGTSCPKVEIVRLGADHRKFFFQGEERQKIRAAMGWDENTIVLGHAGVLQPSKQCEMILQAAAQLQSANTAILLIGRIDAEYKEKLVQFSVSLGLEQNLFFQDFVSKDELAGWLSAFDIGIWPGDMTITILEAMATGRPVVAVRTPYSQALIEDVGAGFLFEKDQQEELNRLVEAFASEPEMRFAMGKRSRSAVELHWNWEVIADQFVGLYQQAIEENRKG